MIAGSVAHALTGRGGPTSTFDGVNETNLYRFNVYKPLAGIPIVKVISAHVAVHYIAVSADGSAYIWGRNEKGQLGSGNLKNIYRAVKIGGVPGHIVGGACGKAHSFVLTASGELYAAGSGANGQLGIGKSVDLQLAFVRSAKGLPEPSADPVVAVSAGGEFSIALTKSGRVWACGSSQDGQLGNGTTGERIVSAGRVGFDVEANWIPVAFPAGTAPIAAVACGQQHTAALSTDGCVYTWGSGAYGRLGMNTNKDNLKPTRVPFTEPERSRVAAIACGNQVTYLNTRQGMLHMTGRTKATGEVR